MLNYQRVEPDIHGATEWHQWHIVASVAHSGTLCCAIFHSIILVFLPHFLLRQIAVSTPSMKTHLEFKKLRHLLSPRCSSCKLKHNMAIELTSGRFMSSWPSWLWDIFDHFWFSRLCGWVCDIFGSPLINLAFWGITLSLGRLGNFTWGPPEEVESGLEDGCTKKMAGFCLVFRVWFGRCTMVYRKAFDDWKLMRKELTL